MCVIVYKPNDVEVEEAVLQKMWDCNSDGAGLAYWDGSEIIVRKGLMKFEDFLKQINLVMDKSVVFHMRIATHGEVSQQNTHPFIISKDVARAKTVWGSADAVLFHNGIISGMGDKDSKSDTLAYVCSMISLTDSLNLRKKICLRESFNRFCIMQDRETWMLGDWDEKDGLNCSNLNWDTKCKTYIRESNWPEEEDNVYGGHGYNWKDPDKEYDEELEDKKILAFETNYTSEEGGIQTPLFEKEKDKDEVDIYMDKPIDECLEAMGVSREEYMTMLEETYPDLRLNRTRAGNCDYCGEWHYGLATFGHSFETYCEDCLIRQF